MVIGSHESVTFFYALAASSSRMWPRLPNGHEAHQRDQGHQPHQWDQGYQMGTNLTKQEPNDTPDISDLRDPYGVYSFCLRES